MSALVLGCECVCTCERTCVCVCGWVGLCACARECVCVCVLHVRVRLCAQDSVSLCQAAEDKGGRHNRHMRHI